MRAWLLCLLLLLGVQAHAGLRVVSLAPSMTEVMLELDAQDLLVGVVDGGEPRPPVQGVPSVGRYGQLNIERLLALKPDLLLLWPGSVAPAQRQQLRELGIATFTGEPHTLDEVIEQIQAIAVRLGRADAGQRYTGGLRARLAQLRQRHHRQRPLRAFYQVWDQPLYTVGGGQVISDALAVCGARNVFAELPQPAPQVSVESVLARDPELIVAGDAAQLRKWEAWSGIAAVAGKRLLVLPDKGLERPSGQMIEATARLCALIDTVAD